MADTTTWRKRVAAWRASGLSASEFCKGRDFGAGTLYWWSSRLGREATVVTAPRLARVILATRLTATVGMRSPVPSLVPSSIIIEVRGARVVVSSGTDAATLSLVLDALAVAR